MAAGEVDLAIGCDQGGSIRVPAAYCGVVGLKPTHGLVPYTGILGLDATVDHAGPITANVADNALLLEVIAGPDGLDGRQRDVRVERYREALTGGAEGLRIGLLRDGFGRQGAEADVEECVRAAASCFERLGLKVSELSIPLHALSPGLLIPVFQSSLHTVFHTDGAGLGHEDVFVASLCDRLRGWRERSADLPVMVKTLLVATEVMRRRWGWRYYAKAMNVVRRLRAAYDAALQEVDVLLLPTVPHKAPLLPDPAAGETERVEGSFTGSLNTMVFNSTHHPALTIPCGRREGLPVGLMMVGRHFDEATLYRAANAFEQHTDWRKL